MLQFDRIALGRKAKELGFVRDTFEKVCRLIDVLSFLEQDTFLCDSLALKGGTAINLTIFDLPRLSVDIDLDFSKNMSREEMLAFRPVISEKIKKQMIRNGYYLSEKSKQYHALDSFVFTYQNAGGMRDNLKIDINYMLRCHILEPQRCKIDLPWMEQTVTVLRVDPVEIFASKIVALLNRGTPRDLYDFSSFLQSDCFQMMDTELLRKCVIYYMTVGSDNVLQEPDYTGIDHISQKQIKADLVPVLRSGTFFNAANARNICKPYLQKLMTFSVNEQLYLAAFQAKRYCPELLFTDANILARISQHPMAIWKCSEHEPIKTSHDDLEL